MKWGVVVFPGSNDDRDTLYALGDVLGYDTVPIWYAECNLHGVDAIVLPGGFSYGDYLRCGAIARFSPVMQAVKQFADHGGLVLGICNGFQVLCEANLLPGALIRNRSLQFRCEHVFLKTGAHDSPFTSQIPAGKQLRVPIAHGEGCNFADADTLGQMKAHRQILWHCCDASGGLTDEGNPNGALEHIAGICNERRNVAGLMPHPERACEAIMGGEDGIIIWQSVLDWAAVRA